MIGFSSFPMINQLKPPVAPADGQRDENADMNCVFASLSAVEDKLNGVLVAPDDIKDATYGQGYQGGADEMACAQYMRSRFKLLLGYEPQRSGTLDITSAIRAHLQRDEPVVITMQSDWNALWGRARWRGLHAGVAYAISETDDGMLRVMNPWGGFSHDRPVREWAARLGIGVWPISKLGAVMSQYGTHNADGSMSFAAGRIGAGMAALYVATSEQGDLSIPETYYNDHESFARFTSGAVFRYDAHTDKSSVDTTGLTVDGLYSAWLALKNAPPVVAAIPADVADAAARFHTIKAARAQIEAALS